VRTPQDLSAAAREIRASMVTLDNAQVVDRFLPMTDYLDSSLSAYRFRAALVAVFAVTGLLLVLVGLAGLTARFVEERRREIGIRLALGAAPSRLWWTTTRDALKSVMVGIAAGILAATLAFQVIGTFLAGITPPSVAIWGSDVALVAGLCALAAAVPAHRVTGVRPMDALRPE